jgi:predicted HD phosphohydrolase
MHPFIRKQTLQHVLEKKADYTKLDKTRMGIWEAMEKLNELVDESDPDTSLSQIAHLLQSAEAARRDGQPRWMILTCLIHDLGKYLFFLGEPQWTVSQIKLKLLQRSPSFPLITPLGRRRYIPCRMQIFR